MASNRISLFVETQDYPLLMMGSGHIKKWNSSPKSVKTTFFLLRHKCHFFTGATNSLKRTKQKKNIVFTELPDMHCLLFFMLFFYSVINESCKFVLLMLLTLVLM